MLSRSMKFTASPAPAATSVSNPSPVSSPVSDLALTAPGTSTPAPTTESISGAGVEPVAATVFTPIPALACCLTVPNPADKRGNAATSQPARRPVSARLRCEG